MLCNIKATYEKGVLRTDHPLDLPDGTQVVLSVRTSSDHETPPLDRGKIRDALAAAGLVEKESPKKNNETDKIVLGRKEKTRTTVCRRAIAFRNHNFRKGREIMSIYYADSSVLVKRHVLKNGSPWVQELFDQSSENAVVTSRVSMVEVLSAFYRRMRGENDIDLADCLAIVEDFKRICIAEYELIELTPDLVKRPTFLAIILDKVCFQNVLSNHMYT